MTNSGFQLLFWRLSKTSPQVPVCNSALYHDSMFLLLLLSPVGSWVRCQGKAWDQLAHVFGPGHWLLSGFSALWWGIPHLWSSRSWGVVTWDQTMFKGYEGGYLSGYKGLFGKMVWFPGKYYLLLMTPRKMCVLSRLPLRPPLLFSTFLFLLAKVITKAKIIL